MKQINIFDSKELFQNDIVNIKEASQLAYIESISQVLIINKLQKISCR
ncbi:MAG: hypothetical protein KatS3mg068_2229 [Candidatus Sericytochromatia bacterium]|nr:MAG: hypothetical protein KatS3mg068_2229 [Candidatus Sericytochromatia bacterium]